MLTRRSARQSLNEWYDSVILNRKKVIEDASILLPKLYYYCMANNKFTDKNLLDKIKSIKLDFVYILKQNVNFGFIHYQILRNVEKFSISFIEDYNRKANHRIFKSMFKNYDKFNLTSLTFELYYFGINDCLEFMVEQSNVFLFNNQLRKIKIIARSGYNVYNVNNVIIPDIFERYYHIKCKHIIVKKPAPSSRETHETHVILRRNFNV